MTPEDLAIVLRLANETSDRHQDEQAALERFARWADGVRRMNGDDSNLEAEVGS